MRASELLQQIPIITVTKPKPKASMKLHWSRRAFQISVLALLILIPATGLFRIDPVDGAFRVLDRQIWFSDFFIVIGFWVIIASFLIMLYSIAGTVFCGWACPQNTFSELANGLTRHFLGKRAEVALNGEPMKVAAQKNRWYNWIALGAVFAAIAMVLALVPLFYFYPPQQIWSFVTFRHDAQLAPSLHWIYTVFALIIFVDVAFIRHFMCRFMCIYKVWQHTFKTKETLHIAYDTSRADECKKCNYCVTACFVDIDPRKTETYDTCINCGECVTACNNLQAKKNDAPGLLTYAIGPRDRSNVANSRTALMGLGGRLRWTAPFVLLGTAMFAWGLLSYDPYRLTVSRVDQVRGTGLNDYRISIANKLYQHVVLNIEIEGLQTDAYRLASATAEFDSAGRQEIAMYINSENLKPGLTPFSVRVSNATDGWSETFRVPHFVEKKI